eukprot:364209-Chlamydomonas_euryale.AAC.14
MSPCRAGEGWYCVQHGKAVPVTAPLRPLTCFERVCGDEVWLLALLSLRALASYAPGRSVWQGFPSCTTAPNGGGLIVQGRPYGSFVCCMVESGTGGRRIGCSGEHWLARCGDRIVVLFYPASVGTKFSF